MTSTIDIQEQIAALEAQKRQAEQAEQTRLAEQTRYQNTIADLEREIAGQQAVKRLADLDAAIPSLADHAERINALNAELVAAANEVIAKMLDINNALQQAFSHWKDTATLRESFIQAYIDGVDTRTPQNGAPERQNETDRRHLGKEIGQADGKLPLPPMIQYVFTEWYNAAPNTTEQLLRSAFCNGLRIPIPAIIRQDYDALAETRRYLNEIRRHGGF